jgi:RNA polymerase sigma-70 factor (ECF subfamily)
VTHQSGSKPPVNGSPSSAQREEFVRALHEAHGRALLGFALSELRGDRPSAEDIVQETMLRAWQHAEVAGSLNAPRAWLFTIAHRLVIDRWRNLSTKPQEVPEDQLRYVGVRDPADSTLSSMMVREALSGLTANYNRVLVEVYLHGRSVTETAAVLGIPPGTVKSRMYRAVRALRAALEAKGAMDNG